MARIGPKEQQLRELRTAKPPNVVAFRPSGGAVDQFKPQEAKRRDAEARAVKQLAAAVKDWEMLDKAVEQEIADQRELVEWWGKLAQSQGEARKKSQIAGFLSVAQLEELCGLSDGKVSRWRKALAGNLDAYRELLRGPSYRKAMGERGSSDQKGASGTGENEWYTPANILELARQVLGDIDLDPASSKHAQRTVKAKHFYTKADDGLTKKWKGRVWLNPPYAQPYIEHFADKMAAEVSAGNVSAAIMLTHNYTDTAWFHTLAKVTKAVCFPRGRIRFLDPKGEPAAPTQGQALFYFGSDTARFGEVFASVGFVVAPMETRRKAAADGGPSGVGRIKAARTE